MTMSQPSFWWQRYGTLAQMAQAAVALLGFVAILFQINEIRTNNRAASARQAFLGYTDLAFKNPKFAQPDYEKIKAAMEASLEEGMESFDQCLFRLAKSGVIEQEEALRAADSRDGLALKFRLSEGSSGEHDPYADFSAGAPSITHGF